MLYDRPPESASIATKIFPYFSAHDSTWQRNLVYSAKYWRAERAMMRVDPISFFLI